MVWYFLACRRLHERLQNNTPDKSIYLITSEGFTATLAIANARLASLALLRSHYGIIHVNQNNNNKQTHPNRLHTLPYDIQTQNFKQHFISLIFGVLVYSQNWNLFVSKLMEMFDWSTPCIIVTVMYSLYGFKCTDIVICTHL